MPTRVSFRIIPKGGKGGGGGGGGGGGKMKVEQNKGGKHIYAYTWKNFTNHVHFCLTTPFWINCTHLMILTMTYVLSMDITYTYQL